MQQGKPHKSVAPKLFDLGGHHLLSVYLLAPESHQLRVIVLYGGGENDTLFEKQQLDIDGRPLAHAPRAQVDSGHYVRELDKVAR